MGREGQLTLLNFIDMPRRACENIAVRCMRAERATATLPTRRSIFFLSLSQRLSQRRPGVERSWSAHSLSFT
jgi:hypothetical protein